MHAGVAHARSRREKEWGLLYAEGGVLELGPDFAPVVQPELVSLLIVRERAVSA